MIDNSKAFLKLFEKGMNEALEKMAKSVKSEAEANAKVKTGNLKRSHDYEVNESNHTATIGNTASYAEAVEFKPEANGGRPWFRLSFRNASAGFQRIIQSTFKGVIK